MSSVVEWAPKSKDNKAVLSALAKDSTLSFSLFYLFHFFAFRHVHGASLGRQAPETYQWEDYAQVLKMIVKTVCAHDGSFLVCAFFTYFPQTLSNLPSGQN